MKRHLATDEHRSTRIRNCQHLVLDLCFICVYLRPVGFSAFQLQRELAPSGEPKVG